MNLIKLIEFFLIDDILNFNNSSFSRYNHLKSFVYCVWNIEHLSNIVSNTKGSDLYPWRLMSMLMNPYMSCITPLITSTQLQ
jgi:hypothetical protein